MKTTLKFASLALIGLALGLSACKKEKSVADYIAAADCAAIVDTANTYTNSVKAIIDAKCAFSGCHNDAARAEGISMEGYTNAKNAVANDEVLCTIHQDNGCEPMPKGGTKLTDEQINKIACWAKNGYRQ